ncbi:MAG: hypothetical protein EOP91_13225 [Lysobacteraceae bacterium]|nr:MAG: hypothetical protein EOP91_13225 [Xanthomonadaceae bacterium]
MGWISLALGILGVVSGIMQALMLLALPADRLVAGLLATLAPDAQLPPALRWVLEHLDLLNLLSLLSSVLFSLVSWGLLKRYEWGRLGFIWFLACSAVAGLAGAFALARAPLLLQLQSATAMVVLVAAALVAALHAAIIWKLRSKAVRDEFMR